MTGEVEAEDFFLHHELIFLGKLGHVWKHRVRCCSSVVVTAVEQTALAALAIRQHGGATLHGPIDGRHEL